MTAAALIDVLHEAGVSCHELAVWTACTAQDGRADCCESCSIGGPDRCESQVIKALARRLVERTAQVDALLGQVSVLRRQREEWAHVADRMTDVVLGRGESTRATGQKRHR